MTDQEIREKIASFPTWLYQFDLRGQMTPALDRHADRHPWRKRHFFDPMVQLLGGSLRGKRVLDLACNAGYWSLAAIEAGADFVQGIEARPMHVEQANFVFQTREIDSRRYNFACGNLFDTTLNRFGQFDVVLCLGIFYHITKHIPLLESISAANTDVLLIDTRISMLPGSVLQLRREPTEDPWHSADYELVMDPTRRAVVEMAQEFKYAVAVLKPEFKNETGIDGFRNGNRRAFICAKKSDLSKLQVPVEETSSQSPPISGGEQTHRGAAGFQIRPLI
jgi:predicted nicotinamide N-methyase